MPIVLKHLSHHYVLKRSIVFIVDPYYQSELKNAQASKYINNFFESMPETDKFGYISLGTSSKNDELVLEDKSKNPYLKKLFLKSALD